MPPASPLIPHEMKRSSLDFTCPRCGWTHRDFAATGQFRCSACLAVAVGLKGRILDCLRQPAADLPPIDPSRGTPERVLAELSIGLQLAVKAEEFELAIVLRDTIQFLQAGLARVRPGFDGSEQA